MSKRDIFKFRLYVAEGTQNSERAVTNLGTLCRAHLPNQYEVEIVDVLRQPERALADGIIMTPTLIKLAPSPVRQIVGTLNQTEIVLQTLGLKGLGP